MRAVAVVALLALSAPALSACATTIEEQSPATGPFTTPPLVDDLLDGEGSEPAVGDALRGRRLRVEVRGERPHDASAFTQGLEFDDDGRLFESRGLYARDEDIVLTEVDPADGSTIRSIQRGSGDPDFFAEGVTAVGAQLIQLTWRAGTAFVYDADTFERVDTFTYEGEGWGICDHPGDGPLDGLYASDGTSTLTHRDPATFEVLRELTVTVDGEPVERINELECVPDSTLVLANVWQTNTILAIDTDTGSAGTIDASAIAEADGRWAEDPAAADVLNGIAWDPTAEVWLLTGKLWPVTYEVDFVCVEGCEDDAAWTPTYYVRPAR